MKEFTVKHTYSDGETATWTGTVEVLRKTSFTVEAEVKGRGSSFTVIAGKYSYGNYLCIPEINVGCPMSRWDDLFWNRERLSGLMNETDSATIAAGMKALLTERTRTKKHGMER